MPFYSILNRDRLDARFRYMGAMPHRVDQADRGDAIAAFAILDQETMGWGQDAVSVTQPPACWSRVEQLVPAGFGFGQHLMAAFYSGSTWLPDAVGARLTPQIEKLLRPRPATVYRVDLADFWCKHG